MGNILTVPTGNVLTVRVGKVLDIYRFASEPLPYKYTGYSKSAVELSLQRLGWIVAGEVDKEALYKMPHQEAARRFAREVLLAKLPVGDQKKAAEKVVQDGRFGAASIEQIIREFVPMLVVTDRHHPGYYQNKLMKATRLINGVIKALGNFNRLNDMTLDGKGPTDEDIADDVKQRFNQACEELAEIVKEVGNKLDRNPEHGKAMFPELYEEGEKGKTKKPAPKKSAPSEPSNEALKAIREKIEKAKARLK